MLGQLPIVDVLVVVSFFCTGRMKLLKPTCYFFFQWEVQVMAENLEERERGK